MSCLEMDIEIAGCELEIGSVSHSPFLEARGSIRTVEKQSPSFIVRRHALEKSKRVTDTVRSRGRQLRWVE